MGLNVSDLTIARGGIKVLEGIGLRLEPGQALVLRGPNGVGKTTLLRTIAGLQPPHSGQVEADPETLVYAGHADGLKPTLTVEENLTFWARVFCTPDIDPAIDAFQLDALRTRPAGALSAGQKRRLGLARLLVTGRPIWILDEPTVSLDVEAVQMFADTIRSHLGQGGSALIATHIDLGLPDAQILDVGPFRARAMDPEDFDEAFL
ncbi:heme ABC exporter ATP-binding protein CcmA [Roseovarius sp. A21]|uniref:Heme ABC exporter ATP-binding protein CcmA n=1 Tax=Roseovarius bejariae TaxID=2576383 RepID=A0A844CP78_9RHOB|nr:heme ABC exporter ATP-binding protein CcmA [Roseovarius bejariae]MRU16412.1 heme ABC exporter ATP-binding protein CcmA [Roseovarius bejariae]